MTTTVLRPTMKTLRETRIAPAGHGTAGGVNGPVVVAPTVPEVLVVPLPPPEVVVAPPELVVVPLVAVVVLVVDVDVELVDVEVEVDVLVEGVSRSHPASDACSPGAAGSLRMKSPPWLLWPSTQPPSYATLIATYGFLADPVAWQMITWRPGSFWAKVAAVAYPAKPIPANSSAIVTGAQRRVRAAVNSPQTLVIPQLPQWSGRSITGASVAERPG
ncbi:MAG: hypothetical protein ACJ74L_03030 [Gaiellaceae bacterium]